MATLPSYEFDSTPTPKEAETLVKRMSTSLQLSDHLPGGLETKEDKFIKIATFSLQNYLKETKFASEFLEGGGLKSLCMLINNANGNTLAYALNSLTSLMSHNVEWVTLTDDFVATIAHRVVNETLVTICRPATAILIKIVAADQATQQTTTTTTLSGETVAAKESSVSSLGSCGYPTLYKALEREPNLLAVLVRRLQSPDYALSLNSLTLLTVMLKYVKDEDQSELLDALEQLNIGKHIVPLMNNHPSDELKEQLLEYQTATIQNVNKRRNIPVSMSNPRHAKILLSIFEAAAIKDIQVPGARKWKKIGFSTEVPQREFSRMGLFGLEKMHTFAVGNGDMFSKIILEQVHRPEGKRCPFAKASLEVSDLLCSHWNINPGYIAAEFDQLLLHFDHIQATTLQCFYRIFRDMEATAADFSKVSALVRSQLRSVLKSEGVKEVSEFDRLMLGTPYQVIRDRRLKELEWADDLLGREAIRNLRARLNKQSYEFIKKQRISCLLKGAWFPAPNPFRGAVLSAAGTNGGSVNSNSNNNSINGNTINYNYINGNSSVNGNRRWRYYKLSTSKKSLQYGDFAEKIAPVLKSYDRLTNKIDLALVTEIKSTPSKYGSNHSGSPFLGSSISNSSSGLIGGSSSTYSSSSYSSYSPPLSFGLFSDNNLLLAEFLCGSTAQVSEWKDGFSMLLDKGITSKDTAAYLHSLTEIGVKVKLLQIAGDRVEVPHGTLEVPPVPVGLGSGFFYDV
ncbi:ELMO/CED-12 family-domain-containing protein [Phycomyces blakesleeanus]|uniref:ELMO/CED-12 family-domain-containing protein n=1 Tax=Phycomyces blakesleeanus TaxID=4837 RepID=A0ABR3AHG2_PHYBL